MRSLLISVFIHPSDTKMPINNLNVKHILKPGTKVSKQWDSLQ